MAVVVAQAVEQQLSVKEGRVGIPVAPRVRIFFFRCCQSILAGHRAFFLSIKWDLSIKVTSLFFPISYHQQCLCNIALSIVTQLWKINPKRGREWPIFKKVVIIFWVPRHRLYWNCSVYVPTTSGSWKDEPRGKNCDWNLLALLLHKWPI